MKKLTYFSTFLIGLTVAYSTSKAQVAFEDPILYPISAQSNNLIAKDLNGDNKPDLIVNIVAPYEQGNEILFDYTVSILMNKGDGTFMPGINYKGENSSSLSVLDIDDINNDGKQDLLVREFKEELEPENIRVLYGKGDGTFFKNNLTYPYVGNFALLADFNEDGKKDILVNNLFKMSFLLGQADGKFSNPIPIEDNNLQLIFLQSMKVSDLNGDLHQDVILHNYNPNNNNCSLIVLKGKGDGTFYPAVTYENIGGSWGFDIADINNDGKLDIVSYTKRPWQEKGIKVLLNVGKEGFLYPFFLEIETKNSDRLVIGDINKDGKNDISVFSIDNKSLSIFLGEGDKQFKAPIIQNFNILFDTSEETDFTSPVITDLNGDNKNDIVVFLRNKVPVLKKENDFSISNPGILVLLQKNESTGIKENEEAAMFEIHPNPAQEELIIETGNVGSNCSYTISDLAGRQMLSSSIKNNPATNIKVNISDLPAGYYVLTMNIPNQGIQQKKFIKQ